MGTRDRRNQCIKPPGQGGESLDYCHPRVNLHYTECPRKRGEDASQTYGQPDGAPESGAHSRGFSGVSSWVLPLGWGVAAGSFRGVAQVREDDGQASTRDKIGEV